MRTIRFRGKDKKGEWIYGNYCKLTHYDSVYIIPEDMGGVIVEVEDFKVDSNTVGQLTVHRDRNGKEIYEGDILRSDDYPFSDGEEKDNYLGVAFCTEDGSFEIMQFVTKQSKCRAIFNFINRPFYGIDMDKLEVIGNIYDNQGLFRDSDEKIMEWYNS